MVPAIPVSGIFSLAVYQPERHTSATSAMAPLRCLPLRIAPFCQLKWIVAISAREARESLQATFLHSQFIYFERFLKEPNIMPRMYVWLRFVAD
jgi:hypothetical protein